MGIMKTIAGLGKFIGKGNVKCSNCKVLDQNNMCYGVKMENPDQPIDCLFYSAK